MTVELACSQQSRNRHTLRFPEAKPVLVFTDAGEAAIFVKATNGTSPPMANLTNLAKCLVGRGQVPLVHPKGFRPTSVQFKSRINSDKARKRHQTRHLEFYTPQLLTEGLLVRI